MKKIFSVIQIFLVMCVGCMFILCILTPDKTMTGHYTNPIRYWTDNDYYVINFVNNDYIPLQRKE